MQISLKELAWRCFKCSALTVRHAESLCMPLMSTVHAETALMQSGCENMLLSSLRLRLAFFSEIVPAPCALLFLTSQEPRRKKQRGQRTHEHTDPSELRPAQIPHASFFPNREASPVLFTQTNQRPSFDASGLVSFGGLEEDLHDDSLSLAESEGEDWSGSADVGLPDTWTLKDTDKTAFLDSPISTTGLFGPAINGFTECFTEAHKSLQAMRHFLPKCSSSASGRPKYALIQQSAKPAPPVSQPHPVADTRQCPQTVKCYPFPKRFNKVSIFQEKGVFPLRL